MSQELIEKHLESGDLDRARKLCGLPEPFRPGENCPSVRLQQEANRFKALGGMEETRGNVLSAEVCHRTALRFAPGDWEALGAVGRLLAERGRSAEAEQYLKAALWLTKGPIRADLHMVRGRLRMRQGRLGAAWRDIKAARRHDPDKAEAHEMLGVLKRKGVPLLARISPVTYVLVAGALAAVVFWAAPLAWPL